MCIDKAEQETVIQISRVGDTMNIWTSDRTMITRLDKLYKCINQDICNGEVVSKTYQAAKQYISFRTDKTLKPEKVNKRQLTAAQMGNLQKGRNNQSAQGGVK